MSGVRASPPRPFFMRAWLAANVFAVVAGKIGETTSRGAVPATPELAHVFVPFLLGGLRDHQKGGCCPGGVQPPFWCSCRSTVAQAGLILPRSRSRTRERCCGDTCRALGLLELCGIKGTVAESTRLSIGEGAQVEGLPNFQPCFDARQAKLGAQDI